MYKCGYCDFVSFPAKSNEFRSTKENYIDLLAKEFILQKQNLKSNYKTSNTFETIYFGGGTPSIFPAHELGTLLKLAKKEFEISETAEITVEANPETLTDEKVLALKEAGFNRLSMGVQSFDPKILAVLDRRGTEKNIDFAIRQAKKCGFSISLDLIYGTPGESLESLKRTIKKAISYDVDHISCYALTISPETPIGKKIAAGELQEQGDDLQAEKYLMVNDALEQAGYQNYEISNWARPGKESRHNKAYWQNSDWLGLGVAAHSYMKHISECAPQNKVSVAESGRRWWNVKSPFAYKALLDSGKLPISGEEVIDKKTANLERIMLGIRTSAGISQEYLMLEGLQGSADENKLHEKLRRFEAGGLISIAKGRITLTPQGRLLADYITRELV
jgi:oxygen-independent coproporphyrinogen-3 oxidase